MKSFIVMLVALVVLSTTSVMADGISTVIPYLVSLSGVPIAYTATGSITYTLLVPGNSYKVSADATLGTNNITPLTRALELATIVETNVTGDFGANILVTFTLPSILQDHALGVNIPITYGPYSAAWGLTTAETNLFDPRTPTVIPLDATGNAFITLAGDVAIPRSAPTAAIYAGNAIISVDYTGL